jgi:hypothetical protein
MLSLLLSLLFSLSVDFSYAVLNGLSGMLRDIILRLFAIIGEEGRVGYPDRYSKVSKIRIGIRIGLV